jgi:hypothetical protein
MRKKLRIRELEIKLSSEREKKPLRIVADAAIATVALGHGKLIPLVILDTSERPDVTEFVRIHSFLPPGDVRVSWVQYPRGKKNLSLLIQAIRPSEVTFIIAFDLDSPHCVIVEQIIRTRALYVQPGRDGDRLVTTMDMPRILVEIGDLGFDETWNYLLDAAMIRQFRSSGMSKAQAKDASKKLVTEWRTNFGNFRL